MEQREGCEQEVLDFCNLIIPHFNAARTLPLAPAGLRQWPAQERSAASLSFNLCCYLSLGLSILSSPSS